LDPVVLQLVHQAQRERARAQQAALKKRQAQQTKRYTADKKLVAEMKQHRQARETRMATHRDLQQRLKAARTNLAQTKQTPQQLWDKLPAGREVTQTVQAATQALDAVRKRATDMARECADYPKLHPARAAWGYGTPHKPVELRQADLAVG
jgi:septal ring factor EnvC (AmiA/AmiB activator)